MPIARVRTSVKIPAFPAGNQMRNYQGNFHGFRRGNRNCYKNENKFLS